jgi:energy-coupling factor transport system permease protein
MDLLRSLPLGLYLEEPVTWMHRLDPRVKLGWLSLFLLAPILANVEWRIALVAALILLTIMARVPLRVWKQQIGWLMLLCIYVGVLILFIPDGLNANHQSRLPANEFQFVQQPDTLPPVQPSKPFWQFWDKTSAAQTAPWMQPDDTLKQPTNYRYFLFQKGRFAISQRSLDMSLRFASLLFTLIYSTSLFLLTTSPEEITAGLEDLMAPLRRLKVPVTEISLTLTLALRFIPLVLEEFQNLVRSVRTRAINWKKLGWRRSSQIWILVAERLLENLLLRAEQIAGAMQVRGFTSPNRHRVEWHQLKLRRWDWLALAILGMAWVVRLIWGGEAA